MLFMYMLIFLVKIGENITQTFKYLKFRKYEIFSYESHIFQIFSYQNDISKIYLLWWNCETH